MLDSILLLIRHDSRENRGYITSVEPKANTPLWRMIHYDTKLWRGCEYRFILLCESKRSAQNARIEGLSHSEFPTCSGLTPGGTHAYSSSAHPESSSEVELLWKPSDNFPIFPPTRDSISEPRGVGRSRFIAHELCGQRREEDFRVTLTESLKSNIFNFIFLILALFLQDFRVKGCYFQTILNATAV